MRKYILLGLLIGIMPNLCLGASIRYSQLIKEKQRKIEELEKCTGSTGKLKIAGISTLGLTAAGVAGNVVEAKKIKEYGKESEKLDKKLETARTEKAAEEKKLKEKEEKERQAQAKATCEADNTKIYINGTCVDKTSAQTQQTETQVITDNSIDKGQEFESQELCNKVLSVLPDDRECYQDTTGKWKIRFTAKVGDPCPVKYCSVHKAVKACKYAYIEEGTFGCAVTECTAEYKVIDGMCKKEQTVTCDETKGEIVASSGDECLKCAKGFIAHNGECEKCPYDKKPAGNKCENYTCGASEFKHWGECIKCAKNFIAKNNHCVECPKTKKAENNECVDFSCPSNSFKSFGECVACNTLFENMVPNADQSGCEPNKTSEVLTAFAQACLDINGKLTGQTKCVLSTGSFEERNKKCEGIENKVNLPVSTGSDDQGVTDYCAI